ncbi:MAG: hypothetical protein JXA13_12140 [Anaerolineales bacterium]|nr:hypothetical protein [Anaerolineales bacterium]
MKRPGSHGHIVRVDGLQVKGFIEADYATIFVCFIEHAVVTIFLPVSPRVGLPAPAGYNRQYAAFAVPGDQADADPAAVFPDPVNRTGAFGVYVRNPALSQRRQYDELFI